MQKYERKCFSFFMSIVLVFCKCIYLFYFTFYIKQDSSNYLSHQKDQDIINKEKKKGLTKCILHVKIYYIVAIRISI